jgi:hypothetical protein
MLTKLTDALALPKVPELKSLRKTLLREKNRRIRIIIYLDLNKKSLRGLNGGFLWCPVAESNHGHKDFQSFALPTELTGHIVFSKY